MAPHYGQMPKTSYPGRPYDRAVPYDWAIEGIFDEETQVPTGPSALENIREIAYSAGAIVLMVLAITAAAQEIKSVLASDAENVPVKLPTAVKRKTASALKVEYNTNLSIGGEGSGVKIAPDVVLTAGHVVLESNPHNRLDCNGSYAMNVDTPGFDWVDQIINRQAVLDSSNDIAVLRVRKDDSFNALPIANIAANQPSEGEPVFFINYEGGGSKVLSDRYPNTGLAGLVAPGSREKIYGHPAEYAGTVIAHEGSNLLVATGQVGYGPERGEELNSHPGASGGPVFNRAGKVIGETIELGGSASVSDISQAYGVNLSSHPSERQISIVQPVTESIVRPLIAGLSEKPVC